MQENYGKKTYISSSKIVEVRNIFKARVGMTEFADNFSNPFYLEVDLCPPLSNISNETPIPAKPVPPAWLLPNLSCL